MQLPGPHRPALAGVRAAIDAIDTLQLALLGMRGRLAVRAGRAKHFAGLPGSDPEREA
ncbi:chorismate mutase, partial [Lysobacter defluvii]